MYEPKEWKDHIIDGEQTYSLQEVPGQPGKYKMIPDPIDVVQEGTPVSASNMNRIENGIAQAHDGLSGVETKVTELEKSKVKRYGVVFSGSTAKGTRVEDAVGMVANVAVDDEIVINDFDKVSFYNRRICCGYHQPDGRFHVVAYRDEPGFAWDGSRGEVCYEETPFYWTGDLMNYVSVSAVPLEGYKLSPRFKNGVDKEYSPVFWASMVNGKPTSRAGVFPTYGSVNDHMANARQYHEKAHTETMAARMSDYILQLVEFATKDLQTIMMGAANMPYSETTPAENIYRALVAESSTNRIVIRKEGAASFVAGQTISIGTVGYQDTIAKNRIVTAISPVDSEKSAIHFDGAAVNIAINNIVTSRPWINGKTNIVRASSGSPTSNTDGKHPCIWRGKVDPWATAFSAICDVLVQREGEEGNYSYIPFYLQDPTKYAAGALIDDYVRLNYEMAKENGYAKTLGIDERFEHVRLTDEVGASSTTYLSAYYWIVNSPVTRAVWVGGNLSNGRNCSPVSFSCGHAPSISNWYRLSRLFVTRS